VHIQSTTSAEGSTRTLALSGEVDLDAKEPLQAAFTAAIEIDQVKSVVVDLADITFLDSSGIGALVFGHRLAAANGATLTVVNPSAGVERVLDLTGISELLNVNRANSR
jgi:anti-sigma B factor antagonist